MTSARAARILFALLLAASLLAACGDDDGDPGEAGPGDADALSGLLRIDAGACDEGAVESGSWFRMVQPGGSVDEGPHVPNGDSPCGDPTWTPLAPGTDGGLRLGAYQPHPDPAFDGEGHGAATAIAEPQGFFAVRFALATNEVDPQSGTQTPAPVVTVDDDGTLTADLRALGVAWNGEHFNQGAPKPDGSLPGLTSEPTGSYDPGTGRFELRWTSQIVGGPFNDFTGVWHLEGTLETG